MSLLNIAGGAAAGYVQGDEDNRRRQEFQSMQNQRARLEKQQRMDDELAATLKRVRPAGDYDEYSAAEAPGGEGPDTGVPRAPSVKRIKRTAADADRERADIMAGGGRLQDLQAAGTLRQNAYAAEAADSAARLGKAREAFSVAGQLNSMGNSIGAARLMAQHANSLPELDGHQLVIEDRNGVPYMAVARNGQYIEPPHPVDQKSVQAMIERGTDALTPELAQKARELGIHQYTAESGRISANAAQQNATSAAKKVDWETGLYGDAQIQHLKDEGIYLDRHGRAALMTAQAHVAASTKLTPAEKAEEIIQTYAPIIREAHPGMPEAQVRLKAAQVAFRDPNAKDPKEANDVLSGSDIVKIQGKYYRPGAKGKLEEVRLPGDTKELANKIAAGLGVSDDGRPSITEPNSAFRSVPTASVTRPGMQAAPISERELHDWVPKLGRGKRDYTNRMTGETISSEEFERRSAP